jgi:hypothetical protein
VANTLPDADAFLVNILENMAQIGFGRLFVGGLRANLRRRATNAAAIFRETTGRPVYLLDVTSRTEIEKEHASATIEAAELALRRAREYVNLKEVLMKIRARHRGGRVSATASAVFGVKSRPRGHSDRQSFPGQPGPRAPTKTIVSIARDRKFESHSLQQRVLCEPGPIRPGGRCGATLRSDWKRAGCCARIANASQMHCAWLGSRASPTPTRTSFPVAWRNARLWHARWSTTRSCSFSTSLWASSTR